MGNENDGLDELNYVDELTLVDEVAEEVVNAKKERKIYKGKKNYRGLDYISGQEPKHQAGLKMQVRGCLAWLDGADKMSYKDMVMLPYAEFMDLLGQFAKATGIEGDSFR